MGRQQAELLGPVLAGLPDPVRDFEHGLARAGAAAAWLDWALFPLWAWVGPWYEDSGFHEEIAGAGRGLGVPPADVLRALFSLSGGSTVFAATRSATADGAALIGRNVDWADGVGARRPLVLDVHPTRRRSRTPLRRLAAGRPAGGGPQRSRLRAVAQLLRSRSAGGADAPAVAAPPRPPARSRRGEGIEIFQQRACAASPASS